MKRFLFSALFTMALSSSLFSVELTSAEAERVGRMVWKNECAGTVEGLVSWNKGENFPSLGIGHFIWYPAGVKGPFDESFPRLVVLMEKEGIAVPSWAKGPAPWKTAEAMAKDAARVGELRLLLSTPKAITVQTAFLIQRLREALPKMLAAAPSSKRGAIKQRFERLTGSVAGSFAMIDYVNFKGEGVLSTERYAGQGWGLLQVLEGMKGDSVRDFADSAKRVLTLRVKNAPPERKEGRWLPGWLGRCERYAALAK